MKTDPLETVPKETNPLEIDPLKIDPLEINPGAALSTIQAFLLEQYERHGSSGILLGLSGGVDSAVVASIAARTVPKSCVYAFYLPDRGSQPHFRQYANDLANGLGIHFETRDVSSLVDTLLAEKQAKRETMKQFRRSVKRSLGNFLLRSPRLYYPLKKLGLRVPNPLTSSARQFIRTERAGLPHIARRQVLEAYAKHHNLLLIGAANRSEALTGWYAKGGVDDLPIEPMLGLYKTQVYQLARFLDVPQCILDEAPSPDFGKGETDELLIGLPWHKTDIVLNILQSGQTQQAAMLAGITPDEYQHVCHLCIRGKKKKGATQHEFPEINRPLQSNDASPST